MPPGRAGAPVPLVFSSLDSCHPLLPPLLWDSLATSMLFVHARGCVACRERAGSVHARARRLLVLQPQHSLREPPLALLAVG